jgi:glycosyltransferase involved in cell wall biosynthesis
MNIDDSIQSAQATISIVIPVHNGGERFRQCLASLEQWAALAKEIIIVVDGGTDQSWQWAKASGARVVQFPSAGGPARARNAGAQVASGDILFFVDADITLHTDTLQQIVSIFGNQPDLAALIGSYDDAPGESNFLSQYKNLFHHYTHQLAHEEASTFWGACGAIRRSIFLEIGGFDERFRYPSVEDIELGYRLKRAGHSIQLCKTVQVKHLKRWEPISLLKAEFFYRALPWSELIWRDRQFINDLNLKTSSRISLVLAYGILVTFAFGLLWSSMFPVTLAFTFAFLCINWSVYQFFYRQRGFMFALRVIPWHWLYFIYGGLAFAMGTVRYYWLSRMGNTPHLPTIVRL